MRPGKANRMPEGKHQRSFCSLLGNAIPFIKIVPPSTTEAGDMIWLDEKTLLIGDGYRTNAAGIAQMRDLLAPRGVQFLFDTLTCGPGPSACLLLLFLIIML